MERAGARHASGAGTTWTRNGASPRAALSGKALDDRVAAGSVAVGRRAHSGRVDDEARTTAPTTTTRTATAVAAIATTPAAASAQTKWHGPAWRPEPADASQAAIASPSTTAAAPASHAVICDGPSGNVQSVSNERFVRQNA